jgi:ABC-type nitrate/sulfonate/bicarbonate transport system substrate-binding protein
MIAPMTRRRLLRTLALGAAGLGLAACGQQAAAPTAAPAKPTEAPKPAAPAAQPAASPAAAAPAAAPAASPVAAAKPAASPATAPAAQPAASPAAAAPALKPEATTLRVIMGQDPDAHNVHDYAALKILEEKHGVKSDIQVILGAGEAIKAIIASQSDAALATFAAGVSAVHQGQDIIVPIPSAMTPYFILMVDDTQIKDWKDFVGPPVGITATNDSSYYTTVLLLTKNGVDPKQINWVTVRGGTARAQALVAGKIAAGQVGVADARELRSEAKLKRFAYPGKDFPNLLFSGYWTRRDFSEKNPQLMQAWADSMLQAQRDALDKAKYVQMAMRSMPNVQTAAAEESHGLLLDMNIWDPNFARWNSEAGDYTAKTLAEYEAVEAMVPFEKWATTKYAQAARQRLGEHRA